MPMVVATSLALSSLMGLMASVVIFIQAIKSPDLAGLVVLFVLLVFPAVALVAALAGSAAHVLCSLMPWAASNPSKASAVSMSDCDHP